MDIKLAVIKGDGIGPEIVDEAIRVLNRVGEIYHHNFSYTGILAGGAAIDTLGTPLQKDALDICKRCDSIILGAVGGPKWDNLPGHLRPEQALFALRGGLSLFANIRPAILYNALKEACPLKPEIIGDGLDIVIVRELTGGIYFGQRGRRKNGAEETAFDTETYSVHEIERIGRVAFEMAQKRYKKLTSVDKANVLESSRLWREVMHRLALEYPDIAYNDMLVDNAAMQLVRNPGQFDVIVTSNMFGDILSDEASMITGSIGMLPSASLGDARLGLYEPIHGSAPDIAGKGVANPIATILSAAMMLRYSFDLEKEAMAIENAVKSALKRGFRTADLAWGATHTKILGTKEMGDEIISFWR
ncbi:MAG: 3-isopropylmalate dehydrogenase [Oligoflexales bacterium]|nr:3-isopropylmalate dehydrogenase [Oligoflexales bacterium]